MARSARPRVANSGQCLGSGARFVLLVAFAWSLVGSPLAGEAAQGAAKAAPQKPLKKVAKEEVATPEIEKVDAEETEVGKSVKGQGRSAKAPPEGEGWEAFTKTYFLIEIVVALVLAAALSASIAYHPKTTSKAAELEEFDQPKILIMYGFVGCVVAEIVRANNDMAFVIFGIGGLLRFRTDIGTARATGRAIFVTCIGLCCGLKIYVVAIIATVFGWVLVYYLESRITHRVVVKGLDTELLVESAQAYEEVLVENGFVIMSQKKNFIKGQAAFVFRAPGRLNREQLEELFKDIPPKLQGATDWESN